MEKGPFYGWDLGQPGLVGAQATGMGAKWVLRPFQPKPFCDFNDSMALEMANKPLFP